jgi:hypothetical protein
LAGKRGSAPCRCDLRRHGMDLVHGEHLRESAACSEPLVAATMPGVSAPGGFGGVRFAGGVRAGGEDCLFAEGGFSSGNLYAGGFAVERRALQR